MAVGIFQVSGSVASNTDTTLAPAPGLGQRIEVLWFTLTVSVAGTTSRARLEDGVGGAVLGRLATATADAILNINYAGPDQHSSGRKLTENTALNLNTSGAAAATLNYDVLYRVRG